MTRKLIKFSHKILQGSHVLTYFSHAVSTAKYILLVPEENPQH